MTKGRKWPTYFSCLPSLQTYILLAIDISGALGLVISIWGAWSAALLAAVTFLPLSEPLEVRVDALFILLVQNLVFYLHMNRVAKFLIHLTVDEIGASHGRLCFLLDLGFQLSHLQRVARLVRFSECAFWGWFDQGSSVSHSWLV